MQPHFHSPCHHHGRHHHHHHHHIPLFVLCPCACRQRHHQHHQLSSQSSPFLPKPSAIACSTLPHLLPNRSSPCPLRGHFSLRHDRNYSSRVAEEAKDAEFSAADISEGQQLTEDQVDDDCGGADDDDEVVFVLTEEWRDFFAKSEAKRKLESIKEQTILLKEIYSEVKKISSKASPALPDNLITQLQNLNLGAKPREGRGQLRVFRDPYKILEAEKKKLKEKAIRDLFNACF